MFENIGLFALNVSMIIRYLISPLLISLNGIAYTKSMLPSQDSYNLAIFLMLYEVIIVFCVFQLTYRKFYKVDESVKNHIEGKQNIAGWLFVIFCFSLIFIYPDILSRYTFVFTAEELKSKTLEVDIASIIPLLFQLGMLVLTISLFNMFYKKYRANKNYSYVIITVIIVLITSSFIMGTSRFSVVLPLATGLYMVFLLFKKYRKSISIISILVILVVVLFSSILKSKDRKSTRLNSSHVAISYAVFCLKKTIKK